MVDSFLRELKRRNVFRVGAAYLVLAWIIIQVTDTAVPALRLPEWVNSLVFYFGAIGFPFALFFAWAFEITPEGVKKESEVNREKSLTQTTGRNLDFVIISLLLVALGYFVWESRFDNLSEGTTSESITNESEPTSTQNTETKKNNGTSIAVLPFVDMSQEKNQEYFTDGISEEILNVLAQVPNLKVTSRSSSFSFKGKEIIIAEVAKKLGVRNILEGSVRKSGTKIRITAQLIDADNDKHLWSETYDRELVDIFKIQDEISAAIVKQLKDKLGLNAKIINRDMSKVSQAAHNEYLKGRFFIEKRNQADIETALKHFTKATELSPDYAPAWMGVAWAQSFLSENQYGNISLETAYKLAKPAADRALLLDPNLPEAHAIMAIILGANGQFSRSQQQLDRAIALNPNYADAYSWLSDSANWQPDWIVDHQPIDALNYAAKAISLNPLSILANMNYAEQLLALGRYQETAEITQQMLEIDKNNSLAYILLAQRHLSLGHYGRGITLWETVLNLNANARWKTLVSLRFNQIAMNQQALELLDGSNLSELTLWYSADIKGFIQIIRQQYPKTGNDFIGTLLRANAETLAGNYSSAIDFYLNSTCNLCDSLIYSYQQIGDIDTANKLLAERKKRFEKLKTAGVKTWRYNPTNYSGFAPIEIVGMNNSYLSGDMDAVVTQLQQAITNGYILEQKYKIHPMYAKLRALSQWQDLLAQSNTHAAKEREIYWQLTKSSTRNLSKSPNP